MHLGVVSQSVFCHRCTTTSNERDTRSSLEDDTMEEQNISECFSGSRCCCCCSCCPWPRPARWSVDTTAEIKIRRRVRHLLCPMGSGSLPRHLRISMCIVQMSVLLLTMGTDRERDIERNERAIEGGKYVFLNATHHDSFPFLCTALNAAVSIPSRRRHRKYGRIV